jgi:4-hydroxy-4-methyl-2-oxoglutarate aldolase
VSGAPDFGYWGEVMTVASMVRGIGGLVTSGGVRDSLRLVELGFPVFCASICIQGTGKNPQQHGSVGSPIHFGNALVRQGDLILGDADGVLVLPAETAAQSIEQAFQRDRDEEKILADLKAGRSTLDIYDLPRPGLPTAD